jgi:hypothetical protein
LLKRVSGLLRGGRDSGEGDGFGERSDGFLGLDWNQGGRSSPGVPLSADHWAMQNLLYLELIFFYFDPFKILIPQTNPPELFFQIRAFSVAPIVLARLCTKSC